MSTLTILANLLTIIVFAKERSLRLKPSNNFILALNVSDMLFGIYVFTMVGIPGVLPGYPYGETGCMISHIASYTYVVGNLLLIAISVDRVLLVSLNYSKYTKFQTEFTVNTTICLCYGLAFIPGVVELGLWNHAKHVNFIATLIDYDAYCLSPTRLTFTSFTTILSLGVLCFPTFAVVFLSAIFFALLTRRIKKSSQIGDNSRVNSVRTADGTSEVATSSTENKENEGRSARRNRYIKPAVTLGVLVLSMCVSMLPYCTYLIMRVFCPSCFTVDSELNVIRIVGFIGQFNPLLDPIFYSATQKTIREFYVKKCVKVFQQLQLRR